MHNNPNTSGLEFEVIPESCLRNENLDLLLGTTINQVINSLQNASRIVKNVELVYCNRNPFERDITITLKNDGIRLHFEPKNQLLKLIEVYDFKNITLYYCNTMFSKPNNEANVSKIESCFGATHPGVYDEENKMYLLNWRGVSFCFPAKEPSSTVQPSYAHGLGSLNFPSSSLPLLQRMTVFMGNSPDKIRIPKLPPLSVICGNLFPKSIESINEDSKIRGLRVSFYVESDSLDAAPKEPGLIALERNVYFGDTEESVLTALGAPAKVYYKSEEKMLIQRGSSSHNFKRNDDKPDFFFNYFSLGLDILFDFDTRRVIKFVLHTNIPGQFDFGIYNRVNFAITAECQNTLVESMQPERSSTIIIQTNSKLEELRELFADHLNEDLSASIGVKPVILNKCSSVLDGENPFGSTFCYGTDQIIVEIMGNSYIASLTLIKPDL